MLTSSFSKFFAKSPGIPRTHISMVGFMNAGKSTVMNAITQQPTSIVDSTPGTTADTKISLMEIHAIGPCKLIDTAGIDESGTLGQKKLQKTESAIKESDIVLLVVDPTNFSKKPFEEVINLAQRRGKQLAVIFNKFKGKEEQFNQKKDLVENEFKQMITTNYQSLTVEAIDQKKANNEIIPFIGKMLKKQKKIPILPPKFLGPDKSIFLNIPLDVESPTGRLLRPQQMVLEASLRKHAAVTCYSMDLAKARGKKGKEMTEEEKARFLYVLENSHADLVITDSQAIDVMSQWTPEKFNLTTFSVAMANLQSGGKLKDFIKGIDALKNLKPGDKVLICEACNHDRIIDDIGTVQIPNKMKKLFPGVELDWAFGRAYEHKNLKDYALALHCGGCMISRQQMIARIQDLAESGVPIANYGLALSWLSSPRAFERVLKPWQ